MAGVFDRWDALVQKQPQPNRWSGWDLLSNAANNVDWKSLPVSLLNSLTELGVRPGDLKNGVRGDTRPYTMAGAANLKGEAIMPAMDADTDAATVRGQDARKSGSMVIYRPGMDTHEVRAHEMEHVLANQGLGSGSAINAKWEELVGNEGARRSDIVQRLVEHAPYLQKTYGLDAKALESGYFSPHVLARPDKRNFLFEQFASLSALEQSKNIQLTKDPYVREHILKTPAERETYNALTGLRQTRLDAKDLPPYTRQKEAAPKSWFSPR